MVTLQLINEGSNKLASVPSGGGGGAGGATAGGAAAAAGGAAAAEEKPAEPEPEEVSPLSFDHYRGGLLTYVCFVGVGRGYGLGSLRLKRPYVRATAWNQRYIIGCFTK